MQVEDTIKKMEKELGEKDRLIMDKDNLLLVQEQRIGELSDISRKTDTNFGKKEDQLKKVQEENEIFMVRNRELRGLLDQLNAKLTRAEEKVLETEESWNTKYHAALRKQSELEQKSSTDGGKIKKELEYANALALDQKDQIVQKDLKIKALEDHLKSLKARFEKKEDELALHQQNNSERLIFNNF